MVAIKFLGVIITFYLFVIFEAFGQNFYPARYGKRNENDLYQEKNLIENRRVGRSENQDVLSRKMGFFISGGRFGKRGCSENCFEEDIKSGFNFLCLTFRSIESKRSQKGKKLFADESELATAFSLCSKNALDVGQEIQTHLEIRSKEIISSGFQSRQDRSERIRIPSRKNQFMIGSRFGKRMEERIGVTNSSENKNAQNLKCIYIGISDLYKCLETKQFSEESDAIDSNSSSEFFQ